MLRVGLTGGIASGKTTVAGMFAARGCRILPADQVAHEVMAPGQPAYEEILRAFGKEILAGDGTIARPKLAAIVFGTAARREQLNRIVHPRVIAEIENDLALLAAEDPAHSIRLITIVEAALLVEAGYHKKLDKLIFTWCRPEQQVERLMQAGLSRAQAEQRLAAQMPPEEKRRYADFEIDCSGSLAATEAQVEKVFQELERLAAARTA